MQSRRTLLGTVGVMGAVAVSGCFGILKLDVDVMADPATVSVDVVTDNGYEHVGTEPNEHHEEVAVFPLTTEFESTWWHAQHRRIEREDATEDGDGDGNALIPDGTDDRVLARFDVVSTPSERVRDREVNPVAHLEHEELLEMFSADTGEGELGEAFSAVLGDVTVSELSHVENVELDTLGEVIDLSVFEATITHPEESGDGSSVRLYVGDVLHEGDIVVPVGVHDRDADGAEALYTLVENLEHPVDL